MVQVFIRQQPKNGSARLRSPSGNEPRTQSARIETTFNIGPEGIGLFLTIGQIGFHRCRVIQEIGNHLIDVGEHQGRKLLCDLFGGRTCTKGTDHAVQGDARSADTHDPVSVGRERNFGGCRCQRHGFKLAIKEGKTRADCATLDGLLRGV